MGRDQTRRQFLTASGAALFGIGGIATTSVRAWTTGVPTLTSRTQPTIGTNPGAPTATVYGSFSCPYTEEFIKEGNLEQIIAEYIEPGYLNLEFRPLEYDPDDPDSYWISSNGAQAGQAAYGVWEKEPERFWDFFTRTWQEMPGWTDPSRLEKYMKDVGIAGASEIASNLESYDNHLKEMAHAGASDGIIYTPQMELDGDLTGPRNDWVFDFIEARIDIETALGVDTLEISEVGRESAIANAEVTGLGGADGANVWVRYWDPDGNWDDTVRVTFTDPGSHTFELDGLEPNTEYEYRARAYTTAGEAAGGDRLTFTTQDGGSSVVAGDTVDVGGTSATVPVELEDLGGADGANVWVRYWDPNGNWDDTARVTFTDPGSHTFELDGLEPNTEYEYRARSYTSSKEAAGSARLTLTTKEEGLSVATGRPANVSGTSATVPVELEDLGGADEGNVWVRYWDPNGNWDDTARVTFTDPGSHTFELDGLEPNTEYEYRARVYTTAAEAAGGDRLMFTA